MSTEVEVSFLETVMEQLHIQYIYDSWQPQTSKLQNLNTDFVSLNN